MKRSLSARENLKWFESLLGCGGSAVNADIDEALEKVGLYGYEDVYCQNMSAGQQRRVALARLYLAAKSGSPKLWILDEPFTAIDVKGVAQLQTLFVEHAKSGGAVILATHQALDIDYPVKKVQVGGMP